MPNQKYDVFVEILLTDHDDKCEYVDFTINGASSGRCHPAEPNKCMWYDCTQLKFGDSVPIREVTSSSGIIEIKAVYGVEYPVDTFTRKCNWKGTLTYGVIRLTMTPKQGNRLNQSTFTYVRYQR